MPTVDEVIVVLEARMAKYERDLARADRQFRDVTNRIDRDSKRMEASIRASSEQAGNAIKGLAATFAAAFSASEVARLADGYTRFTNRLKVAGLEGQSLASVQEQLFGIAQQNGVQLEALGTLYGRAAGVSRELGASQAQLVQFTTGVAAALRIQGTSTEEASGALLQLGQLLGSNRVLAEEFNSVNEGARPILQAVADNIDAAGGSVSRLKALVTDGKISNKQFFDAFLAGSAALVAQSENAALTIGNSFQILDNALGRYIGQTDASLSASERISQAIIFLADNIETLATALTVLASFLLGRFVASMVAAAAGTGVVSAAIFAMQARALGAATTMEALAFASTAAGRSMLAAFGGPVGLAVTALTLGVLYLSSSGNEQADAAARQEENQRKLADVQSRATAIAQALASATGQVRREALANAEALRQETIQMLAQARAALFLAQAKAAASLAMGIGVRASAENSWQYGAGSEMGPNVGAAVSTGRADDAAARQVAAAAAEVEAATARLAAVGNTLNPPSVNAGAAPGPNSRPRGNTGQSAADAAKERARRERQWLDTLDRARIEELQAQSELETSIELRAVSQRKIAGYENDIAMRGIDAQEDISEARKEELRVIARNINATRGLAINAQAREALERQRLEAVQASFGNETDLARAQMAFAETRDERLGIELRLLDLQHGALMAEQVAIRDNADLSDETRDLARRRIAVLEQLYGLEQRQLARQAEAPGARYLRELGQERRNLGDRFQDIAVDGLDSLNDGLVEAIMNTKSLGDVFKNVADQIISDLLRIAIRRAIIEPLANALFGGGSGNSFGIGAANSAWGAVQSFLPFKGGRAGGGPVSPGGLYRVGENGPELISFGRNGMVIPNAVTGVSTGRESAGGGVTTVRLELSGDINAQIDQQATNVAVQVVRAATPGIMRASSAETMRRAGRRSIAG